MKNSTKSPVKEKKKKEKKPYPKRETMVDKLKDYQHIKTVPFVKSNSFVNRLTPEWLDTFIDCIAKGIDITQTCKILDISSQTFYKYIDTNQIFNEAYQKGIALRRYRLEQALHKRAEGYSTQEVVKNYDAEGNLTSTKTTDKEYVPDATSLIFALKNVYGDKYKDKVEQVITSTVNVNVLDVENTENIVKSMDFTDYELIE